MGKVSEIKKAIRKDPSIWVSYGIYPHGAIEWYGGWAPTKELWNGSRYNKEVLPYLGVVMHELRKLGIYCECTYETYNHTRRSRARGRRHGGIPRRVRRVVSISETDGGA